MQAVSSDGSMSWVAVEDLCWLCCVNPVPVMLAALEEADLPAQGSVMLTAQEVADLPVLDNLVLVPAQGPVMLAVQEVAELLPKLGGMNGSLVHGKIA